MVVPAMNVTVKRRLSSVTTYAGGSTKGAMGSTYFGATVVFLVDLKRGAE